jgi:hypothetical protein
LRFERVSGDVKLPAFALAPFRIELDAFIQNASSSASFTSLVRRFLRALVISSESTASLSFVKLPKSVSLSEEALERPFFRFLCVLGGVGSDAVDAERLSGLEIGGKATGEESSIARVTEFC